MPRVGCVRVDGVCGWLGKRSSLITKTPTPQPPQSSNNQPPSNQRHHHHRRQVSAITPFQIVTAITYGFIVYGMAGLRHGAAHIFKNGLVNTLIHLIASQVRPTLLCPF
jgi:hypothetical protein